MSGHTKTPWRVDPKRQLRVMAGEDDTICSTGCQDSLRAQWEANAEHIVRCVNSHDALVKALEKLDAAFDLDPSDENVVALAEQLEIENPEALREALEFARAALSAARPPATER